MTSSSGPDAAAGRRGETLLRALTASALVAVTFSVAVSSIAMGGAFIVLAWMAFRRTPGVPARIGIETAFLLYVAAELLASAFSVDPADSFRNMRRVLLIGMAYAAGSSFRTPRQVFGALLALGAAGAVTSAAEIWVLARGGIARPGLYQLSLTEGGVRMLIVLMLLPLVLSASSSLRWRVSAAAALAAVVIGLIATQARSAWAGTAAGLVAIGLAGHRIVLWALPVLAAAGLLLAPQGYRDRVFSVFEFSDAQGFVADSVTTSAESNVSRLQMISTGWRMFLDRPVFGWGDIGLRNYYVQYVEPLTPGEGGHLHNNLMEALVTLGAPGFLAVVYLFVMMFVLVVRARRGAPAGSFRAAIGAGLLASFVGFQVLGLFEYNFGDHEVMVAVWFLAGLAAAARRAGEGGRWTVLSEAPETGRAETGTARGRAGRVTAVVITLNEERNIGECLDSLRWTDERIVVDAGSTDRTAEAAAGRGARVITKPWDGYGRARNAGIEAACGEWILVVDADERVGEGLAREIRAVAGGEQGTGLCAYEVARRAYFLGRWIRHCGWYPGRVVRLFRKGEARYDEAPVHEKVVFAGTPGRLANDLDHYTDDNLFHYLQKFDRYTTLAAGGLAARGREGGIAPLVFKPPFQFVRMYLLRAGFLDGMRGLILSLLSAAYVFVKYAKLMEGSRPSPR